jgi:hypothetical protein
MPQIFRRPHDAPDGEAVWRCVPLEGEMVALGADGVITPLDPEGDGREAAALLVRSTPQEGRGDEWILISRGELVLNGYATPARIAVLADRDELRIGGETVFVSYEREARIERYQRDDSPHCPRCHTGVERGHLAVACPGPACGVVYHQDAGEGLPCWLWEEHCALCQQPTPLDAGLTFDPSDL